MNDFESHDRGKPVDEPRDDEWAFKQNPAVRALLDHVAEDLAAEFMRLIGASAAPESEAGSGEEER